MTGWTFGGLDGNPNAGMGDIFLVKYDASGKKHWTKQFGTPMGDRGMAVATDISGNIYVTGFSGGDLEGNINAGMGDIFLAKYDSSGNKLWTRHLGSKDYDCARGVVIDGSGNIYLAGYTEDGLDGNTNAGSVDIFLVKYDSSGNKLWTKQFGTESYDFGAGVAIDGSGNIYVTGFTEAGLDGNTNAGYKDIFLIKLGLSIPR